MYLMSTNRLVVFILASEHDVTPQVPRPSLRFAIPDEIGAESKVCKVRSLTILCFLVCELFYNALSDISNMQ